MVSHPFDPNDLARVGNPYPLLAELRGEGPVSRLASGYWAVTGYAEALMALKDKAMASGPIALRFLASLPEGAARDEMSHRINFLDPPDHPRVRGLVLKAFTPRRVADLTPWMEATVATLMDGIDASRPFDLLQALAHQLPSLVISELLGVPAADRDRLTAWSDAVAPLLAVDVSPDDQSAAVAAAEEFHAYLGHLLEDRRKHPGNDLLSALVMAEDNGERLHRTELLSLAATLYSAGHRTTRDLFANGMATLLSNEGHYQNVVTGRWRIAETVAEFLRFETPTLFVARIPTADLELGGVTVGAYEPVLVYLAAANRDPKVYEEPNVFRPGRSGPGALSFAHGAHFCLGAALATTEAEVMLRAVTQRWRTLRLVDTAPLHWHLRGPFRGVDALMVISG